MSVAGIRSNRGDSYQTLVAFDFALKVLTDPDYQWIEIDSTSMEVDDVVIGKSDGKKICCQCKKNQKDYSAWTVSTLGDELDKAVLALADQTVEVRFYSRSPFGSLAKLCEHSKTQPNEKSYLASLGQEQNVINSQLVHHLPATQTLSTYDFLYRTSFETSPELDRMEELLRERLRYMANDTNAAYDALWRRLDNLGSRMGSQNGLSVTSQHRLTKEDLKSILHQSGAMLVPIMDLKEIRNLFISTSTIGRTWRRDIANLRIQSPVVDELLNAINEKKRSILLTGLPGAGKTCVMLQLQDELEKKAETSHNLVPLFIQSRDFANLATAQDRQAFGLPEEWVEKIARLSEEVQVVVVIDSLDVLSISREHSVLTYFLAQIDRLLLLSNVTVVTSCRDFDRKFDRRIAERDWDAEFRCDLLCWKTVISPFLNRLCIEIESIDEVTRELIRNPRELALFVELAQQVGSFNIITSQALAQRYLDKIVLSNPSLGESAMHAIEALADEMLSSRSLTISSQRFSASANIMRELLSHNVLINTQDGKLTFGHQTLLDVLVISSAIRQGITLHEFIQNLPPVPFVRPSIRSFIDQLALGERSNFRRQLRTILTSNLAFHIRRLVAESFAEKKPFDEDWPLINDLRNNHREVFQVVYNNASTIYWHHFWFKFLVPILKNLRDADGMMAHVHQISQWKNEDTVGVLSLWLEVLDIDWIDKNHLTRHIGFHLSDIKEENLSLLEPLLKRLINLPKEEYSTLGKIISRCIVADEIDEFLLWRFVVDDISDDDVLDLKLESKLRCRSHEFGDGDNTFLLKQMEQSSTLLDLFIQSIEKWSQIRISSGGSWWAGSSGFLSDTSYNDTHSQNDLRHIDSIRILMNALEAAIISNAKINSQWWNTNRQRICFSHEGALRYFGILACTNSPEENVDLIENMLCDVDFLESDLTYELGTLIQTAFIYFNVTAQENVLNTIFSTHKKYKENESDRQWIFRERTSLIFTIPCHLRSNEAQEILNSYMKIEGQFIRQPNIRMRGGMISAPFSFDVFLKIKDENVVLLLEHYQEYYDMRDVDFLTGGEREVGNQLREAASRNPTRFLSLLTLNWPKISNKFRDDIMEGIANYLAHLFGNLQPNANWLPIEEADVLILAKSILDELDRHITHWRHNRASSKAIQACSYVIENTVDGSQLVFLALNFLNLQEVSSVQGDSVNLMTSAINMKRGHVVEALMILANNFGEKNIPYPELLLPTLRRFSVDDYPEIRVLILRRLPYLQSRDPILGWELFNLTITNSSFGLWENAEPCLYYAYHSHFDKIAPSLKLLHDEGIGKDLETWGRISALSTFVQHIDFSLYLARLKMLDSSDAWNGAASVWTNSENYKQHREQCLLGIESGLSADKPHARVVAKKVIHMFRTPPLLSIPIELIKISLSVLESDKEIKDFDLYGFDKWISETSLHEPECAMNAIEVYLPFIRRTKPYFFDHDNNFTQLLTRLFADAEEREDSDSGNKLQRVVAVQDQFLSLGLKSINDWLKAAERP